MNLHTPPPAPYAADIRAAFARVSASAEFRSSPQLVAFLRLVVEMTLRGDSERIKAYIIGTDAFGRDQQFDPQRDPIVRVEANRLRRALAAYYAGAGTDDPIIIGIPAGRYVPTFRLRFGGSEAADLTGDQPPRSWWPILAAGAAIAALALMLVFVAGAWFFPIAPHRSDAPPTVRLGAIAGAPIVMVEAMQAVPTSALPMAAELSNELARTLATFKSITIMSGPVRAETKEAGGTQSASAPFYRLTGLVEQLSGGRAAVSLQLVSDGVIAWTREWHIAADGQPDFTTISREAGTELFAIFGVIHARLRSQSSELAAGFRCLMASADYIRKFDMTQHQRVRGCLEQTVAEDPGLALALAMLAFVYEREYFVDLPPRAGEAPPRERAHAMAQRAFEVAPDNAVVQLAIMEDHYIRGDLALAFAAGEKAIAINPLDPAITGAFGVRLVLSGNIERGAPLLQKSAARYGVKPTWLDFGLFCVAYLKGDAAAVAQQMNQPVSDSYPFGMVARALAADAAGDRAQAKKIMMHLAALYPSWSDPKPMLERFIRSPDIVARFMRDIDAIMAP